jgi:hypothetical protein
MAATDNESGTTSGRESDSEKIDRIAAYVRDQRRTEKSWTASLGRFTTYLALAAFFFGVGTFADLRNRVVAPPPAAADAAKDGYVKALDQYCTGFVGARPSGNAAAGWAKITADDLDVLAARNRMNLAWNAFPVPRTMAPEAIGAFESIKSYYFAASDLLQAAVDRAKAGDAAGYALAIGLYRQTNAAFLKGASDFGFTVCNHYWTVDDVPAPTRS